MLAMAGPFWSLLRSLGAGVHVFAVLYVLVGFAIVRSVALSLLVFLKNMADPLSFFAGDVSSSSESEGEGGESNGVLPLNDRSYYTSNDQVRLHRLVV